MAALVTGDGFDLSALDAAIARDLPPYAQPRFLRMLTEMQTTGTFKPKKTDLVAEGFDPAKVSDPLYVREAGQPARPLDAQVHTAIVEGRLKL